MECTRAGMRRDYLAHVSGRLIRLLPELDFAAELGRRDYRQHHVYTRAVVREDDGIDRDVLCFGPLSVLPAWQNKGVGASLVGHSLDAAAKGWHGAVLIYGDPAYYKRFGLSSRGILRRWNTDGFYLDALQALVPGALNGVHGIFLEDAAFDIDKARAEAFNACFPKKEKRSGLKSQLLFQQQLAMKKSRG
ncbi:MAG: N-acetyltransferase [Eubacteriales bacterium]